MGSRCCSSRSTSATRQVTSTARPRKGNLLRFLPVIGHAQSAAAPSRAEPDRGDLDYRTVFAALERLPYTGWTGAEYKPAASTDDGLGWAKALGVAFGTAALKPAS